MRGGLRTASRGVGLAVLLFAVLATLMACGTGQMAATETPRPAATTPPVSSTPEAQPTPVAISTTDLPTSSPTLPPIPTSTVPNTPTLTSSPTATPVPSRDLVAFETYRDGNGEIYLLDARSGQLTNLSRHPADDRSPAWRPDGGALAFESHRDGNWEIYVLELAEGTLRRLTDHVAYDGAPAWSPDGQQIALESYRDGNLEIYVIPAGGGEPRRLTQDPAGDYGPAWSPDGGSLAFTSWRDGNKEIYIVSLEGGEPRAVTRHPADDEDPAWAPDGLAIAFTSWRDEDADTGNRNAEIYQVELEGGETERLTDSPWPDLDAAWDDTGRLVWVAYDPGPDFETYDPYRPGDYHIYRARLDGPERLTETNWDDRHPAPAPQSASTLRHLSELLPQEPAAPTALPTLVPGALVQVIEVPSILASFSEQPIRVSELVASSLVAWQQDLIEASGWDFLHMTLGAWRHISQVRKKEMYVFDYGYLSWHKAGRALDLALEFKKNGSDQMVLTREDLGSNTYWRMYLRTSEQDGTLGEPLKENPWLYWWRINPDLEPEAYDAGGKRLSIPAGYFADVTAIAKRHGWERIACYAIEDDYHWHWDSNGTEYWHYERTDGLAWWDAMRQLYSEETLEEHVGWEAGLRFAQSEAMMTSKGVPTPAP